MLAPHVVDDSAGKDDLQWWALYTRHQHEKVVAEMLVAQTKNKN